MVAVLLLSLTAAGSADDFLVTVTGVDSENRDGRSVDASWKSLAYACERVPEGPHTIRLGSGTFTAARTARPARGVTIVGRGHEGPDATRLVAATDWPLCEQPSKQTLANEYLIALSRVDQVSIRNLVLASEPSHRITGAVLCQHCQHVAIHNVYVCEFRWAGLHLEHSSHLQIHHCRIENASVDKDRFCSGLVRTRWIKHSHLHHNQIVSTVGKGYGYKGSGHEAVRIHHNLFDVVGGFAIESAHENEYGVEIDHNQANRCISIPKSGQGADPASRGYPYSFWIHHNLLTDSYTVEGPRNHLRLSHNYIRIEQPNGRVYTHHGGINHGPVWIHHNVIENLDRAFVWMNNGLAENIHVYNNTVLCADAGKRAGAVLGAYTEERLAGWVFKNNVIVAPKSQPRRLYPSERGVPTKITATNNLLINVNGAPPGNHLDTDPGFAHEGARPWPFYAPASSGSFIIDRGTDVRLPFLGVTPDLGAYELNQRPEPLGP